MDPSHLQAHIQPSFPPPPPKSGAGKTQYNLRDSPYQPQPAGYQPTAGVPPQSHPSAFEQLPLPPVQLHDPSSTYELHHPQPLLGRPGQQQGGLYIPPPLPPRRANQQIDFEDVNSPIHYSRDPHKLVAYLVPFPKPVLKDVDPAKIPDRFLIYTPPPPPLTAPPEGKKEASLHKVQRKWQDEVRSAKSNTDKVASWKGIKSRATKGISWAVDHTTTSNLDFLGRVAAGPDSTSSSPEKDTHADDGYNEDDHTKKTVGVEEMMLIYPVSMGNDEQHIREEFVNTMLRTKTKAQRDAIISTGLMPVAYGIDILIMFIWPFGGLGEVDTVWAYSNIRGAKTARSVTKRLNSHSASGDPEQAKLYLRFRPSSHLELLRRYLAADCHKTDSRLFPEWSMAPTETQVLEAIGWNPSQTKGEPNWEDEQWEVNEVREDLKLVMHKAAREWQKWSKAFEKDPEKAMKI